MAAKKRSAPFNRDTILESLNRKWSKKEIASVNFSKLTNLKMAMLLSHFSYSSELVLNYLVSTHKKNFNNTRKRLEGFFEDAKKNKIDMNTFTREKVKRTIKKGDKSARATAVKTVKKYRHVMDIFNIGKDSLTEALTSIGEAQMSEEGILKAYKELYILLMAKAKGELVTRTTNISYKLVDDENDPTGYRKEIVKNSSNEKRLYETTQSHLPDERAFAGALIVLEVIDRMENGNQSVLTNDELEATYDEILEQARLDKQKYLKRGEDLAMDAEIMDE